MGFEYSGYVFKFGDNINTDYLISSRRKRDTLDLNILKQYIMEDIRPGFYNEIKGPSVIVGGWNFGCGSAMEVATQVVKANGIMVVIAKSYSRSYYRNCINNGIVAVEMDTDEITEGDQVTVRLEDNLIIVKDDTTGKEWKVPGYADDLKEIILAGGIMNNISIMMK